MATKKTTPAAPARAVAPARRASAKRAAAASAGSSSTPSAASGRSEPPNLIRAGLQAFDKARQDVAAQQSRVFEAILGFEPAQGLSGLVGRENPATKGA